MLRTATIDAGTASASRRREYSCRANETTELNFVHFNTKVSVATQAQLHQIDGILCSEYLPYDSYLVLSRCADRAITSLERLPGVSWVGAATAEHKLDPALQSEPTAGLVVTLLHAAKDDTDLLIWADELRRAGYTAHIEALAPMLSRGASHSCARQVVRVILQNVTAQIGAATVLAARAEVRWIEPARAVTMRNYDARWLTQGGVSRGDEPLTRAGLTGEGQVLSRSTAVAKLFRLLHAIY
jgi:hypothetical protein